MKFELLRFVVGESLESRNQREEEEKEKGGGVRNTGAEVDVRGGGGHLLEGVVSAKKLQLETVKLKCELHQVGGCLTVKTTFPMILSCFTASSNCIFCSM